MSLTTQQLNDENISTQFHLSDKLWKNLQREKRIRDRKQLVTKLYKKLKQWLKKK